MTAAHVQRVTHSYTIRYPDHAAREDDPHYKDFDHLHKQQRASARCAMGEAFNYAECEDAEGKPVTVDATGKMSGLELHHAHIEFALMAGVDLAVLESVYPGVSDPEKLGEWVESAANLVWLCAWHHRGHGGTHLASASDYEAEHFVKGLIA